MPLFKGSYAYDVPHYADFVVEAATEEEADAKIQKAFKDGVFDNVECESDYDGITNHRAFVGSEVSPNEYSNTLDDLIATWKEESV